MPVSDLPNEILHDIFLLIITEDISLFHSYPPTRLTLSLVCVRWHDIVDGSPLLWNAVSSAHKLPYSEMALTKSATVPIVVDVGPPDQTPSASAVEKHAAFMDLILRELHRWNSAQIFLDTLPSDALAMFEQPALKIEKIALSVHQVEGSGDHAVNLFGGEAPALRKLELVDCTIPWTSPILRNLSRLSISHLRSTGLSPSQWLHTLGNCTNLAELELENITFTPEVHEPTRLTMPQLKHMRLKSLEFAALEIEMGVGTATNIFLASMHAPHCIRLDLATPSGGLPVEDLPTRKILNDSFPGAVRVLDTAKRVVAWVPEKTYGIWKIDSSAVVRGRVKLCFPGLRIEESVIWLASLSPNIPRASARIELEKFVVADQAVPDTIDACLLVHELSMNVHESFGFRDLDPFLSYLGETTEEGAWRFKHVRSLSLFGGIVHPKKVLEMLRSRYGHGTGASGVELPRRLRSLHVNDTKRFDQKIFMEIAQVVAPIRHLHWTTRDDNDGESESDDAGEIDGAEVEA